jgi:hypothetical protein
MTEPFIQAPRTSPPLPPKNGRLAKDVNGVDHPVSSSYVGAEYDRESPPGVPRWVKLLGIGLVVLVLLFAGMHVAGGGAMHMPGAHGAEQSMHMP